MHAESPSWAQDAKRGNRRVTAKPEDTEVKVFEEKKAHKTQHLTVPSHFDDESSEESDDFYPSSASPSASEFLLNHHSAQKETTPRFFQTLRTNNGSARKRQLEKMIRYLRHHATCGVAEDLDFVKAHIPSMVLLASECPYSEVRVAFHDFLLFLSGKGVEIPSLEERQISYFIQGDIPPIEPSDQSLRKLFRTIFVQTGRVSNLTRIIGLHPTYAERFYKLYSLVMGENGPLQLHIRHYVAILAASQVQCEYLVDLMEQEFLFYGGDQEWLEGLHAVPKKISNLVNMTAVLVHQPWLLQKSHVAALLRGGGMDGWSIGELVHALVIMSTFRSLAGVVFACGVMAEPDTVLGKESVKAHHTAPTEKGEDASSNPSMTHETVKIVGALLETQRGGAADDEEGDAHDQRAVFYSAAEGEEEPDVEKEKDEEKIEASKMGDLARYVGDAVVSYEDFDVRAKTYSVFRVQDYSWKEHGYSLISRFYEDLAPLLDDEFDHIFSLTYHTILDHTNVDTAPFRESIWYYVHRINGMLHEDYDYRHVNTFLNRHLKLYVKKLCFTPKEITMSDFNNMGIELKPEEKVHVALLAACAEKQAMLLYGLHAIMQFMT